MLNGGTNTCICNMWNSRQQCTVIRVNVQITSIVLSCFKPQISFAKDPHPCVQQPSCCTKQFRNNSTEIHFLHIISINSSEILLLNIFLVNNNSKTDLFHIFLRSTSYIVFSSNNTSEICVRTIINVYKIISEQLFSTNKSSEIHLVIILTDTETETATATNVKRKFLEKNLP